MIIDNGILYDVRNKDLNADGSFIVPNSVTTIGGFAFCDCTHLKSIIIPNSVTSIKSCAFSRCSKLTSITISGNITSIGDEVFCFTRLTSKPNNYKAFLLTEKGELLCRGKTYAVWEKSTVEGNLEICKNGIHYCTNIFDIFNYYCGEYGKVFVIGLCEVSDENIGGDSDSKRCARWVKPTRILSIEEVIKIMNGEE